MSRCRAFLSEGDLPARLRESGTEVVPLLQLSQTPGARAHSSGLSTPEGGGEEAASRDSSTEGEVPNLLNIKIENNRKSSATEDIETKDKKLREAIYGRDVASVKWLLATGASLAHRVDGKTPLHLCIDHYCWKWENWRERGHNNSTHRHKRFAKELEITKEILEAAKGKSDILDCLDESKWNAKTAMFMAIECGDLETVQALERAGARIDRISGTGESPLHVATRSRHHHILKYFLDKHEIPNSPESHGFYPMHFAAISHEVESVRLLLKEFGVEQMSFPNDEGSTPWHRMASATELARFLFEDPEYSKVQWDLNVVDKDGRTPLAIAAMQGNVPMTALLVRNGANLVTKGENESTIKYISSEFNNSLTFFEELFDECIHENEEDETIKVDYKMLAGRKYDGISQLKALEDLVRFGQSKILKHPTIESLIYFKWSCLLPMFYMIILTYVMFLLSFNVFVITTFNCIDTNNTTSSNPSDVPYENFNSTDTNNTISSNSSDVPFVNLNSVNTNITTPSNSSDVPYENCGRGRWILVTFIYLTTIVLFAQECIWVYLQRLHHFWLPETWVKLFLLVFAWMVPVMLGDAPAPWQRHVACAALLLAWLQAMLLLSRFSGWGYYVLMFERVAINILKILATTICMVIGFSTCLMIQYQSKPPFDGPLAAFIKTLVMMLSEFDYTDLFDASHDEELKNTKTFVRLLFVVFVIFIAIVLMNFTVGVAVSDVSELNDIGNIRRLEKQVELLSTLEGLGDTVLVKWWRKLPLVRFHSDIGRSTRSSGTRWIVDDLVEPNSHDDSDTIVIETFPSELHNAILDVVKRKKNNVNKLDAVYDAVVRTPYSIDNMSVETNSERIKSIEDANKDMKQSIEDIKYNVKRILSTLSSVTSQVNRGKLKVIRTRGKRKVICKKN